MPAARRARRSSRGPAQPDARLARRGRAVGACFVLVLLSVTGFALWSSRSTSAAAESATAASGLSDDYADAASAVNAEESLDRLYRLDPSPTVRADHTRAGTALVSALANVRQDGNEDDQGVVDRALAAQATYKAASERMFQAVDQSDPSTAQQIDQSQTDPPFALIAGLVRKGAENKHQLALAELADLQHLESLTRRLTPLVFLAGILLALMLATVTRGQRRLLGVERVQAVHNSLHDSLTGLPNRELLADRVGQALRAEDRSPTHTGLLLIDLDRFKDINDTFGHQYGDDLLKQVGDRLIAILREADTAARLGGDEFAVLLPGIHTVADAHLVATKLAAALENPFRVEGIDLHVEASIGIVLSGEHGLDASTLLQRADIAMYAAKDQNLGICVYDPVADGHSPAKLALLGDLRRAIDRRELVLHYQPQVSLSTGDVVAVEALVRWQHPERGLVFPDAFIPLAEHSGLIGPLSRYVLDAALAQARAWVDAGKPLRVAANLSARNLLEEHLPEQVAELLTRHGVSPDLLELEVTESALMTDPVRAVRVLQNLSALGLRISIDDFGAGYTSLGQLKDLPVSELKIDRSFVMTMTEDPRNAMIVRSVVELGHNLGLTIVAEGVETEDALTTLADIGCDVAQGYHLSRPITVHAFDIWRAEQHRDTPEGHARTTRTTPA